MRILVCEFITGGGLAGSELAVDLLHEGELMLRSLLADLAAIPGLDPIITRDARLDPLDHPGLGQVRVDGDPWALWAELAADCDACWPIAPETGGALERLSRLILASGCRLIGSPPEVVALCASKQATAARLGHCGLPVVPTVPAAASRPAAATGWVLKPDDGAGSVDTRRFLDIDALEAGLAGMADTARHVLQPYLPGTPASLSLLCGEDELRVLACNRQLVRERDGRLSLVALEVNALAARIPELTPLARAVVRGIPGLRYYVGVDLVLTDAGPVVLEVNPRLTTAYPGLGAVLGCNPAALILGLEQPGAGLPAAPESRVVLEPAHG